MPDDFKCLLKYKEYKGTSQNKKGSTSLEERKEAELVVIKLLQAKVFSKEIKSLEAKKAVAKTKDSKLYKLNPLLDEEGVLRVGGRLSHATLHPHVKHPAILPKDSHISTYQTLSCKDSASRTWNDDKLTAS